MRSFQVIGGGTGTPLHTVPQGWHSLKSLSLVVAEQGADG